MTRPYLHRGLRLVVAFGCLAGIVVRAWGQFETRTTFPVSGVAVPSTIAIGDFNHDGKLDLAITGNVLTILLGKGNGTFQPPITYTGAFYSIAVADFNNDGNLDLVVAPNSNSVSVFLGNGNGTFQAPKSSPTTHACGFIAVGNFNRDGKVDIVVIDDTDVSILLGNGDGTFQAPIDNNSFVGPHQLAVGDFNNDHILDVAVVGSFGGGQALGVLLGNGTGTLQDSLTYPLADTPGSVAAADFNSDGNLDVAIGAYFADGTAVLLGNGDGSFQPAQTYPGGGGRAVMVGDFNRDGKLDLVAGLSVAGVAEFLGNGDGTFQPAKILLSNGGGPVVAGDLNGDHLLDVVLLDSEHGKVSTMLNTGVVNFSPSSPLSFPAQLINTASTSKMVQLTNTGSTTLSISSTKASGPFQTSNTCGSAVAAGASCKVSAVFTPSKSGTQSGGVTIADSASSKPQFIELIGVGTVIKVSPTSLNFGNQKVGTQSASQVVTLTNEGTTQLQYNAPTIVGKDPKDFSETDNCTGRIIPPGGTCQVNVTFAPKKTGTRSAALYAHPQGTIAPQPVALAGTGM